MLADSGCLIIKLFLDISKKEQKARFDKLEASPDLAWTISDADREEHKKYNKYRKSLDAMLDTTDTPYAP